MSENLNETPTLLNNTKIKFRKIATGTFLMNGHLEDKRSRTIICIEKSIRWQESDCLTRFGQPDTVQLGQVK